MRVIEATALPVSAGYVQIGTTADGRVLLDAATGAPLPTGAVEVSKGAGRYERAALGTRADRVLDATWDKTVNGAKERVREKMHAAVARNPTITILESDLPPHRWLGE